MLSNIPNGCLNIFQLNIEVISKPVRYTMKPPSPNLKGNKNQDLVYPYNLFKTPIVIIFNTTIL